MRNEHAGIRRLLESDPSLLANAEALLPLSEENSPGEDGARLVRELQGFVSRFVILPSSALLPLALWILGTHVFDAFETFPYLALLSPEKGCGKTRTTEVIEQVVANPVRAVSVSEAALFRLIDSQAPTLILDEAEVLTGRGDRADAVRALLNAGNRSGAKVPRCAGSSHELRMFSVYCPKVVCAIRVCPETVRDRAVVIPMQRKMPSESVERFILRRIRPEGAMLRGRIAEWVKLNRPAIVTAYERLDADFLSDRELENSEPLLAILTVADPARLGELRAAAEALAAGKSESAQDESLSLRLLADIRMVWSETQKTVLTRHLLELLKTISDAPWAEEFPLNERKLARFLAPFGVRSADVRAETGRGKGYKIEELRGVFSAYLVPIRDGGDNGSNPNEF
jgi:hypothetical protein